MPWIEALIGPHQCYQIVRIAEICNTVGVTRQHMNGFDFLTTDFEFHGLIGVQSALADHPVTGNNNKELPCCANAVPSLCRAS